MVLGLFIELMGKRRKSMATHARREGKRYVNILGAQRLVVNGKEYFVKRIINVSERGIVAEDLYGKTIVIPLGGGGGHDNGAG